MKKKFKKCCGVKLHAKHLKTCNKIDRVLNKLIDDGVKEMEKKGLLPKKGFIIGEIHRGQPIKPAPLMSYLEDESIAPKEFRRAAIEFFKDAIIALDFIVLFSFLALIGVGIILFT